MRTVVIIDVDEDRAQQIAGAFQRNGCAVTCLWKDGGQVSSLGPIPDECLLLFYHVGDRGEWPPIKAARTIFYGGIDPDRDTRYPADAEERIFRPVTREAGTPTEDEARDILHYVEARSRQEEEVRPPLLEPRKALQVLPTLAILCQGYLFLHAFRGVKDEPAVEGVVARARQTMGWKNLLVGDRSYRHLLPPDLTSRWERVCRPDWWLAPFREPAGEGKATPALDLAALRHGLRQEWDWAVRSLGRPARARPAGWSEEAWKEVDKLLQVLEDETKVSSPVITPGLVAGAYCAVADVLGAGPEAPPCSTGNSGGTRSTTTG